MTDADKVRAAAVSAAVDLAHRELERVAREAEGLLAAVPARRKASAKVLGDLYAGLALICAGNSEMLSEAMGELAGEVAAGDSVN